MDNIIVQVNGVVLSKNLFASTKIVILSESNNLFDGVGGFI
jgi:hypothetical protein